MSLQKKSEDFYIGYLPHAPKSVAAHLRKFILVAFACGALAALLFVIKQKSFAFSVFEFLQPRSFEGMISIAPYPTLSVIRPGNRGGLPTFSRYLLVAEGKHGALPEVAPFNGKRVKLQGTLIYRDDQTMIELAPNTIALETEAATLGTSQPQSLGTFTLLGEIVDSKCFLGVMNPGEMKTHRACAVRCIAGGIPPLLITRNEDGMRYFMLLSATGRAVNEAVLDMVAQPVRVTGEVWQYDNVLALRADTATYRLVE